MLHKTLQQLGKEFDAIEVKLEGLAPAEASARRAVSADFGGRRCPSKAQLAALARAERKLADTHRRVEQICDEAGKLRR